MYGLRATVSDVITSIPFLPSNWKDAVSNFLYGQPVNPQVYEIAKMYKEMIEERRETEINRYLSSVPEAQQQMFRQLLQAQIGAMPVKLTYDDVVKVQNEVISKYNLTSEKEIENVRKLSIVLGVVGMGENVSSEEVEVLSKVITEKSFSQIVEENPVVAEFALGEMTLGNFINRIRSILGEKGESGVVINNTVTLLEPLVTHYSQYLQELQEGRRDAFIEKLFEKATVRLLRMMFENGEMSENDLAITQIKKVAPKIEEHLGNVSKIESLEELLTEIYRVKGVGNKTLEYFEGLVEQKVLRTIKSLVVGLNKDGSSAKGMSRETVEAQIKVILKEILGKDVKEDVLNNLVKDVVNKLSDKQGVEKIKTIDDLLPAEYKGAFKKYYTSIVKTARSVDRDVVKQQVGSAVRDSVTLGMGNNESKIALDVAGKISRKVDEAKFVREVKKQKIIAEVEQNLSGVKSTLAGEKFFDKDVGECVLYKKDNWEILCFGIEEGIKEENIPKLKKQFDIAKNILAENSVRYISSVVKVNDRNILVLVREKTEPLDSVTEETQIAGLKEITEKLWRNRAYDKEFGNNNWKENYGVNSEGKVVLKNPAVVVKLSREEEKDIVLGQMVQVPLELPPLRQFKNDNLGKIWGVTNRRFDLDPLGLANSVRLLVKERKEYLNNLKQITEFLRGSA
jgi:hypothetical protein